MKLHVGTDRRGLVHGVVTGPASECDITRLGALLHGQEHGLFGDQAYLSEDHRQQCRYAGIPYWVNHRAKPGRTLTDHEKTINRSRSRTTRVGSTHFMS
jgi:IS5 family transposase